MDNNVDLINAGEVPSEPSGVVDYNAQTGEMVIVPQPGQEVPQQQTVAPETTEAPAETIADPMATLERLKQELALKNGFLNTINIDPAEVESISEQVKQGFLTPEAAMQRFNPAYKHNQGQQPAIEEQQEYMTPSVQAAQAEMDRLTEESNREIAEGGVSAETMQAMILATSALNDAKSEARFNEMTQRQTAEAQAKQVEQNVHAVLDVFHGDPVMANATPELQSTLDQVALSFTDSITGDAIRKAGQDPRTVTTQQYQYFAGQAQSQLNALAEHYIGIGRQSVHNAQTPQRSNQMVTPMSPGAAGTNIAASPQFGQPISIKNHRDAARQYMQNQGRV